MLQNFKYVTIEICEQIGPKYWLSDTLNTVHHGTVLGGDKDQPLADDKDATAAWDGSPACEVKDSWRRGQKLLRWRNPVKRRPLDLRRGCRAGELASTITAGEAHPIPAGRL